VGGYLKYFFTISFLFTFIIHGFAHSQVIDNKSDKILADTLPKDMITCKVLVNDNPSPGNVLISTAIVNKKNYLYILDTAAYPVKYKSVPIAYDFKLHPNGLYSYAELAGAFTAEDNAIQIIMNDNLDIIDTIRSANGYNADIHDFLILPNGHYLIMSYDPLPYDFSMENENGNPGGILTGAVFQELDRNKKSVFQWRSVDFVDYRDTYAKASLKDIDYFHINSAKQDWDGNFIISSRHMNQILKIDRHTGEVIWKLGGKQNEFTFINENEENSPDYFSFQHDVQRINNGNILFYDNGNQRSPVYSRVVEYKLDEVQKTAELVWEYRHNPDMSSGSQGSVQRLKNGNTIVDWGASINPLMIDVTEVTPEKKVVWEMGLPKGITTYRAVKHHVNPCQETALIQIPEITENTEYAFKDNTQNTGISIFFKNISASTSNYCEATSYPCAPMNPEFDEPSPITFPLRWEIDEYQIGDSKLEIKFDLKNFEIYYPGDKLVVYARPKSGEGKFEPLSSVYDKDQRTVTALANYYGEFVIGMPDTILLPPKPALIYPADLAIVNTQAVTKLKISPKGRVNSYEITISEDVDFNSESAYNKVQDNAEFEFNDALSGKTYYWRARTTNPAGTSDWSETRRFSAADPFLKVQVPNGGENYYGDTIVIRWSENLGDSIKIDLLRNGETYKKILFAAFLPTGGYKWRIPKDVAKDSVYQFRISSTKDTEMFDISDNYFSISLTTGIQDYPALQNRAMVYPNPTDGPISIDINELLVETKAFSVYSVLGEKLFEAKFDGTNTSNGIVKFDLSFLEGGVYLFRLSGDNKYQHGKLIINK
jgi:hypothetical protein